MIQVTFLDRCESAHKAKVSGADEQGNLQSAEYEMSADEHKTGVVPYLRGNFRKGETTFICNSWAKKLKDLGLAE